MNVPAIFVRWLFAAFRGYIVDDASFVEAPTEIPDDAEEISNEDLYKRYGPNGISENIRLFIQNGHIYVYYESVNGVKVWQSVEFPHGWRVREDFQLVCYSWYNPDDSEIPQNLRILVFFDKGFLKLTFSSKSAHHDHGGVGDYNVVRLVNISVHPYFGLFDKFREEQTMMHQYVHDESMFFVSVSRWNEMLAVCFEEYYFGDNFAQEYCKVVLPLSSNVKFVENRGITTMDQWSFFDLWGKLVIPDFYCTFKVEMVDSQEFFLVKLRLIPPSDLEKFLDDIDGLRVYRRGENRILGCEKSPKSTLCGVIEFLDWRIEEGPVPNGRLFEIFPVTQNK